jgi:hypothetical protein
MAILFCFPSFSAIQKMTAVFGGFFRINETSAYYLSMLAIILFVLCAGFLLVRAKRLLKRHPSPVSSRKASFSGMILIVVILILLFGLIYPSASSGKFGGGSDRDEALNIAVNELLKGEYPYYERTYVSGRPHETGMDGNMISPFPGELFMTGEMHCLHAGIPRTGDILKRIIDKQTIPGLLFCQSGGIAVNCHVRFDHMNLMGEDNMIEHIKKSEMVLYEISVQHIGIGEHEFFEGVDPPDQIDHWVNRGKYTGPRPFELIIGNSFCITIKAL